MYDSDRLHRFIDRAEQLCLQPRPSYSWHAIVTGAPVARSNGTIRRIAAVERNTFRGFHRLDKSAPGAGTVFQDYLVRRQDRLLDALRRLRSKEDLHRLENNLSAEIKDRLGNIKPAMLAPYNKIRKVLDLYVEMLVTMAQELEAERQRLVPWLHLPLDSQMLASPILFTGGELRSHRLTRTSTYASIRSESAYRELQRLVAAKARALGERSDRPFHPIYFDLLWNDRYRNRGGNLFETVP